ncbi:MAG TPA: SCP2 sterol-binding domain-containing protein [Polyangiaceae bacterium]
MSHVFPSEDWAAAYKQAINDNAKYKEAGKDWTHGAVAMVVKADPKLGIEEDMGLWLDIERGVCRDCKLMPATEVQDAPFVIVADYARWKSVIRKELDPIKGMMQNKLKLTKGHMPTIVKYVNSSRELVETTAKVDTKFRDE